MLPSDAAEPLSPSLLKVAYLLLRMSGIWMSGIQMSSIRRTRSDGPPVDPVYRKEIIRARRVGLSRENIWNKRKNIWNKGAATLTQKLETALVITESHEARINAR
jgi:hypothetical protein